MALVSLVLCGCPSTDSGLDDGQSDEMPDSSVRFQPDTYDYDANTGKKGCHDGQLQIIRVASWPGGGLQLSLIAREEDGTPIESLSALSVAIETLDGTLHPAALSSTSQPSGITAIVIQPAADEDIHQERIVAVKTLMGALPLEERIALWRLDENATLLADFSTQRRHLLDRLNALAPAQTEESLEALDDIAKTLRKLESPWGTLARDMVVVSNTQKTMDSEQDGTTPISYRWISGLEPSDDGAEAASTVAQKILEDRQGIIRAGVCADLGESLAFFLHVNATRCGLSNPTPAEDFSEVECDAIDAAGDNYPFGEEVEILLTEEEKAIYDENYDAQSKEEMSAHLRFGPSDPVGASIHFRGRGSLKCVRKSFTVNLEGSKDRRILSQTGSDRFVLISLCKDYGYFHQLLANTLYKENGVFPLNSRLVRLRINGNNEGLYLLLDLPASKLEQDHVELRAVIRRRLDFEDEEEDIKYPEKADEMIIAQEHYDALAKTIGSVEPEDLLSVLSEKMDIDGYLRWMALNTFLRSGDYVDEAYFYASEESDGQWYFQIHGWDADDLYSPCHIAGKHAILDPHEILYCAEGDLDDGLLLSTPLYDRFIEHLEFVLTEGVTPEHFEDVLEKIKDDMWKIFSDDETAKAMVVLKNIHSEADSKGGIHAVINAIMESRIAEAQDRRAELMQKIDAYRASQ